MKLLKMLFLLCVLCAPQVYGQGKFGGLARRVKTPSVSPALERTNITRSVASRVAQGAHAIPKATSVSTGRMPRVSVEQQSLSQGSSTIALQRQSIKAPTLQGNKMSRKMQREAAQKMRPFLFNSRWKDRPAQPSSYSDLGKGISTKGNLTEMSAEQFAQAEKVYLEAMTKVKNLSEHADAQIYYLGTSEAETLVPEQLRRTLGEVVDAQAAVFRAQIIWGVQNDTLQEAELYLKNMQNFYTSLSTGMYFEVETKTYRAYERPDGHEYVDCEFGLWSESVEEKIPQRDWKNPMTWFSGNSHGVLPEKQRVAVLQDSEEVINGLQQMKARAQLDEWQIDVYEDPEQFLNTVNYEQYDLILTDVLIKNGGGRYLARQLRNQGYEGTILTLSGFDEVHGGKLFFDDGIDGMISLKSHQNEYADHFWASLNNYFILKQEHGWKH